MKTVSYLFIYLLLGLIVSCSVDNELSPVVSPISAVPINPTRPTSLPTFQSTEPTPAANTPVPTFTLTPLPTSAPSVADDLYEMGERTPIPTAIPSPTSTPLPTHYDVPPWVNDPQTAVLVAIVYDDFGDEAEGFSFLNATTGEQVEIPLPENYHLLGWGQDEEGLYFTHDISQVVDSEIWPVSLKRLYVATGEVHYLPLSGATNEEFIESPDGHYAARITRLAGQTTLTKTLTIVNHLTGQEIIPIAPLPDNKPAGFMGVAWSSSGDFLAVSRSPYHQDPENPTFSGLVIYTPEGEIFRQYDEVRSLLWSPNSNYILLPFGPQPCILDVVHNTTRCLEEITTWSASQNVQIDNLQWLPDGRRVSFVSWSPSSRMDGSSFCIFDLESKQITCPITQDTLSEIHPDSPEFIMRYGWSSDGQYLWLQVDPYGPDTHDRSYAQFVTVAGDGSQLRVWGYGHEGWWRPFLTP